MRHGLPISPFLWITNHPKEWGIFFGALLYTAFLHRVLGMDAFWDTANYHYFIGWAAANLSPYKYGALARENTFFNPLIDCLNYLAFGTSPYLGAAMHSAIFAFSMVVVYKIALRVIPSDMLGIDHDAAYVNALAIGSCVIGATAAMTTSLFGSFTNEHVTTAFILLALLTALDCFRRPNSQGLPLFSGILAGIAVALKLTATPYALALWVSLGGLSRKFIKVWILCGCGLGIGYFSLEFPFMVLRWNEYGNPLFPFANQIFHSPYYPSVEFSYGSSQLKDLGLYLTLPVRWLASGIFSEEPSVRDGRMLLAFLGILALLVSKVIWRQQESKERLLVLWFFVGGWVIWILLFRTYRYIVVLEMLSGIILVAGLSRLRLLSQQRRAVSAVLLLAVATFLATTTTYPRWGRRPWQEFAKASFPFPLKKGNLVFFADLRLGYLAPQLVAEGANVANFYAQPWIVPASAKGPIDPAPIPLPDLSKIYLMQYGRDDPRPSSPFFAALTAGTLMVCKEVATNMLWNPIACRFSWPNEVPRLQTNKEYSYDADSLLFLRGWSLLSAAPRISELNESLLVLRPPASGLHECLKIHFEGEVLGDQMIKVIVAGRPKLSETFSLVAQFDVAIQPEELDGDGLLNIKFSFPWARHPNAFDPRLFAFTFKSLKIMPSCGLARDQEFPLRDVLMRHP